MTLTREANVSVTTTTEMLYCIEHECMVEAENGEHVFTNGGWDFEPVSCMFPLGYAFCPPPDEPVELTLFDGDWAAQDDPENEEGFWLEGVE